MSIGQDIKRIYFEGDLLTKLILINCAAFVVVSFVGAVAFLFSSDFGLGRWLSLPALYTDLIYKPWTLLTYMFLHENLVHLLINIMMLYWIGRLFIQFFGTRNLISMYVIGGLCGAVLFLICYNTIPVLQCMRAFTDLRGASASITAMTVAIGIYRPDMEIRLTFIGYVKLKWIAIIAVLFSLITMQNGNAGGNISHLGGAIYGAIYAIKYQENKNMNEWLNSLLDKVANMFSRKPKWKVIYNNQETCATDDATFNMRKRQQQQDIDIILDKIKKTGYSGLSDEEKQKLIDASKK